MVTGNCKNRFRIMIVRNKKLLWILMSLIVVVNDITQVVQKAVLLSIGFLDLLVWRVPKPHWLGM